MTNNIACRLFKEQIKLINQLPEKERPLVLYLAINHSFNQIENQIENQNENAYVSESLYLNQLSDISKCVLELLKKNIVCKEFSNNYGGKRDNAGRKGKDKISLSSTQDEHKNKISVDKAIKSFKNNNALNGLSRNKILITEDLNLLEMNDPDIPLYKDEYGYKIILDVQNWLVKNKKGTSVDKEYIIRQFNNFAYRQGNTNRNKETDDFDIGYVRR